MSRFRESSSEPRAVWQRVRRCGVVIFVDFDQYLLAPRASARRSAITAVGKGGAPRGAARVNSAVAVVLQTRRHNDPRRRRAGARTIR